MLFYFYFFILYIYTGRARKKNGVIVNSVMLDTNRAIIYLQIKVKKKGSWLAMRIR